MGTHEDVILEDDFICLRLKNESNEIQSVTKETGSNIIQFHFVLKGMGNFQFNNGTYNISVNEYRYLNIYNTQLSLTNQLELQQNSWNVSSNISIKKFYSMFSTEAEFIPFLNKDAIDRKHYEQGNITQSMSV